MTPHDEDAIDWAAVETLFPDLLELPPAKRGAFLDRHCRNAPALRRELEAMLAASGHASVLDRTPQVRAHADAGEADVEQLVAGDRVGAWRILRPIGRGGMGEVYLAERADGGFVQRAAIKLLHRDATQHAERFEEERRILAQLSHPNIAHLLDGGFHDGRAWMAMEFVPGHTLTEHCRANALPLAARLKLFHQACAAVAHAHGALVIHRDLKPSNILVNEAGQVKLLDFSIAKLIDPNGTAVRATHTTAFTPDHAAPEQIEGGRITIATDLYALGVVLYEMLGGRLPWSFGDTPLSRAVDRLLREDPPPPSRAAREVPTGAVPAQEIEGDLDAIVARCLRRLPQDRYPTVQALQDDLDRHARRLPVRARDGGRRYVARLWLRRHRMLATTIAVACAALLAGTGIALWQAGIARREAAHAREQQRLAEAQRAQVAVQANSSLAVQELLMQMFSHAMAADGGRGTSVRDVVEMLQMMGTQGHALDDAAKAQLFLRLARLSMVSGDALKDTARLIDRARPLVANAGSARPRLLAQQLDVQQTLAMVMDDPQRMVALTQPLLHLLNALPQPLDAEMQGIRLNALRTLGWGLEQLGRFDDAIAAQHRTLQAMRERYGPGDPRVNVAQSTLARAYARAGRYAESARLTRGSLAGASTMDRVPSIIELAYTVRQAPDGLPKAERLLRDAQVQAMQKRLPAYLLAWVQAAHADVLRELGDTAAAAELLREASAFRPAADADERAVRVAVLTAQSDLAWATGDAAASGRHAQEGLEVLGEPAPGSNSARQKSFGLRLRVLRAQAATLPASALRVHIEANVHGLDALRIAQRAPYLTMAAEALRLGGMPEAAAALAKRAVAEADAEPEPNPRVQAAARGELQRDALASRTETISG
jgi:tetratricopeptide (TPR) repeat protein